MRLIGSLSSGDVPSASEINDGAMALNQMLDAWNAERVSIFCVQRITTDQNNATLMLKANQQAYLVGNSQGGTNEDFFLPRPPRIERVSVLYNASQSTPVELNMDMYDDVQWQAIPNKSTPSLLPQVCWNDKNYPDYKLYFWPIPNVANPVVLYAWQALTEFTVLTAKMAFPPGYPEAIRFNLALRLQPEFQGNPNALPMITKLAKESKDRISSFNAPIKTAQVGREFKQFGGSGNIYTDTPSRGRN